jgi:PKD repeat protein
MLRTPASLAAIAILFVVACDEHAPILPTDPGTPGVPALIISVASDRVSLDAGSPQPATLTVTARMQDGTPAADGADVALNTNLGHFGLDGDGKPLKLITAKLVGGSATVRFYAGAEAGTANVLAQVGTSVGKLNVAIGVAPAAPVADFAVDVAGLRALFTDMTAGTPTSRRWTFGDGSESSEISPAHDYQQPGTYTVTLTVANSGGSSVKSKFVTVAAPSPLTASFTTQQSGLTVLFTDTSTGNPTSWQWDFGDGTFDTRRNPQHVYGGAGTYAVTLTVRGAGGIASTTSFVSVGGTPPVADFKAEVAGLRALFTDTSTGAPTTWLWDFGDGTTDSKTQNPTHDYKAPGTYTVTLTAGNVAGSTKKSQFVTVSLGDPPKAAFTFKVEGLDVAFTDASTGAPTSWTWDFGDGSAPDTRQNPAHRYSRGGTYTVTLTVSNAAGTSAITQLVKITTAPTAEFTAAYATEDKLTITFRDLSSGGATAWLWNFGDCDVNENCTSTLQHPTHSYVAAGDYTVTFTASNSAGQSVIQKTVRAGQR